MSRRLGNAFPREEIRARRRAQAATGIPVTSAGCDQIEKHFCRLPLSTVSWSLDGRNPACKPACNLHNPTLFADVYVTQCNMKQQSPHPVSWHCMMSPFHSWAWYASWKAATGFTMHFSGGVKAVRKAVLDRVTSRPQMPNSIHLRAMATQQSFQNECVSWWRLLVLLCWKNMREERCTSLKTCCEKNTTAMNAE